ncbi:MAG TPA: tRNA uridine-5-carboxymethylaminomethyl(34) synthesis enzyme MnmG [bacterium]|nr:tRNA uridine-5-carboxymethylaminomethyl(34) synthesis enzyme MnmG [bacterium]
MARDYQIIVVGGGHAGYEAAHAAATRGASTLLIAMDLDRLGLMSCNPAVGGLAKGQMVREIDALGGLIGKIADATAIQFRTLNLGRGPAVRAVRTQNDRALFAQETARRLRATTNLTLLAGEVTGITARDGVVTGVTMRDRTAISADAVVIACGTFLNGIAHIGMESSPAGRDGDRPACGLTESIVALGIRSARLKTGTPARIDGRSIDYCAFIEQKGDTPPPFFSLETTAPMLPERSCWLGHTNEKTAAIIRANIERSPLYSGRIKGIGPRYCPSFEDKIVKFSQHQNHQVFIEPEGIKTDTMYVNGMSTSMPEDVQDQMLKSVQGLENVIIEKYGYAIEYDYFPPTQLRGTLESRVVAGLFFVGQVNGTSGYEEAAGQGIIAGINASLRSGEEPLILRRDQAYVGVLIDDLITKGTEEPYRMFTSRAEHRLQLRDDSAIFRLTDIGYQYGLIDSRRKAVVDHMKREAERELSFLRTTILNKEIRAQFTAAGIDIGEMNGSLEGICQRKECSYPIVKNVLGGREKMARQVVDYVESETKYAGYIEREKRINEGNIHLEKIKIPDDFVYEVTSGISREACQKLQKIRPDNLGQSLRISGVSPADVRVIELLIARTKGK